MPSTYAHFNFGQIVFSKLDGNTKLIIAKYHDLFNIGLHGPDILLYHQPLKEDPINQLGNAMHDMPGVLFFTHARHVCKKQNDHEANLAYLFGFICHFALDSKCHPLVEKYSREHGVSHTCIEVEFDRYLMTLNDIDIAKFSLAKVISPTRFAANVIRPYFKGLTSQEVYSSLNSMVFIHRLLHPSNNLKRNILYIGMKAFGAADFTEHVMSKKPIPECDTSNMQLKALFDQAVENAYVLIKEFERGIWNKQEFNPLYEHTFGEL